KYGVQRSAPSQGQWNRSHGGSGYVQPGQTNGQNTWRGDHRQGQYNGYRNGGGQGQYNGYRNGSQYTRDRNGRWQGQNNWRGHDRGDGWWRGQRGFERYEGRRDGYWFAPGWGYYQPDSRWYGYDWEVGGIVPYELRGYYVSDPYAYDLPPAPYGCEWIYLGDQLVLIDRASGQIVDMGDSY
ncbi:MAG TPA: RcnB family protein, partial [Caulobacteraceae bacterium]